MWLFGIFSPILIFIIVHQVFIPQIFGDVSLSARKQKEQVIRNPVLKAVVIFSVMYTTRVFFSLGYTQMYTLWSLYLHALLYEHLGWNLILVILSVLVNRSRFFHDDAASICMTHLLFFTVSFTLLGIADVLADDGYVTLYEAILLPVLRLEILLLLPIAITVMQFDVTTGAALFILVILQQLSAGMVAMWSEWLQLGWALLAMVFSIIVTAVPLLTVLLKGTPVHTR